MGIVEDVVQLNTQYALTVYVFHMGGWSDWCRAYIQDMEKDFVRQVERQRGNVFFVSAESQECADQTCQDWQSSGEFMSDPNCELAHHYKIPVGSRDDVPAAARDDNGAMEFSRGFIYPGVLAFYKDQLIFRWVAKLDSDSLKGAKNRPAPSDLFEVIRTIIQGKTLEGMTMKAWGTEELKKRSHEAYRILETHYKESAPHLLAKFQSTTSVDIPAAPCHVFEEEEQSPHKRDLMQKEIRSQPKGFSGH